MQMNMKHFRKIAQDKDSTTFQHKDGHKMTVLHKALSPKMRGDIAALPIHKDEKTLQKSEKPSLKMADGGPVTQHQKDMEAMQAGAGYKTKVEEETPGVVSVTPATSPPNATDEAYKASVRKFNAQMNQPGMAKGGQVQQYAEGTPDEPVKDIDYKDIPDATPDTSTPSDRSPPQQTQAPQQQAPVVVNVSPNPPSEAAQVGASAAEHIKDAFKIGAAVANPALAIAQAGYNIGQNPSTKEALQGFKAGIMGQPLPPGQAPAPSAAPQGGPSLASMGQQAPPAPGSLDPFGTQATYDAFNRGLQGQKAALASAGQHESQQAAGEAGVYQKNSQVLQEMNDSYQANFDKLNQERQAVIEDYKNQHIDPNHFWGSKDTTDKIGTIAGLILGGLGGPEVASSMYNKLIDRDIDAQKAELGKSENLLSANYKQFGNLHDAVTMTRVMQNDIASSQLKDVAAQANTQLSKDRANMAIAQLDTNNAQMIGQLNMRRTLLGAANKGQISPEKVIEFALPPNEREAANKELKEARDSVAFKDMALNAFDVVAKQNNLGNRVLNPVQSTKLIAQAKQPMLAALSKDTAGRFTEADAHMLDPLFKSIGDGKTTVAQAKQELNRMLSAKLHFPKLNAYGIDQGVLNSGQYDAQGNVRRPAGFIPSR